MGWILSQQICLCSLTSFPTYLLVCGFNSCPPSPLVFGLSHTSGFFKLCIIISFVIQTQCREIVFRYHFGSYSTRLKSIIIALLFWFFMLQSSIPIIDNIKYRVQCLIISPSIITVMMSSTRTMVSYLELVLSCDGRKIKSNCIIFQKQLMISSTNFNFFPFKMWICFLEAQNWLQSCIFLQTRKLWQQ